MATIEYGDGTYFIAAGATETFTFWWRTRHHYRHYLDVTPWPMGRRVVDGDKVDIVPEAARLTQLGKTWTFQGQDDGRYILLLTLRNEERFDVAFSANHCYVAH